MRLGQLGARFTDYNEGHPDSVLGWLSPESSFTSDVSDQRCGAWMVRKLSSTARRVTYRRKRFGAAPCRRTGDGTASFLLRLMARRNDPKFLFRRSSRRD